MLDQRGRHIGEHGLAVLSGPVQFPQGDSVAHRASPRDLDLAREIDWIARRPGHGTPGMGPRDPAERRSGRSYLAYQKGSSSRLESSSIFSGGQLGTSIPRCSPMLASTSLISFSDLRPKFGVRSISASVF